ncbi:MAG: hypothetical protein GY719_42065 [bacterium]|nr:hypothetical protein [bacterium]
MHVRTKALDCLYLNWALPHDSAPPLPPPLRYEVHEGPGGGEYIFASALLFRLSRLRLETLPFLRLSYPQMNCRVYVLDGDGVPSVLFRRMLVPLWSVPVSRLLARQPAAAARFSYPRPSKQPCGDSWSWTVRRRRSLEVTGRVASPDFGPGPRLGSWEQTLDYFRQRTRGYVVWNQRLRPIQTTRTSGEVWPLAVEVGSADLVAECVAKLSEDVWRSPHSAWLCPEIPFVFELAEMRALSLARGRVPAAEGC